jgi:PIN domain nuclease of toxin-antitoxin system
MLLDTHAVVFLHAGETELFTETARALMEAESLVISPMVYLELEYLFEIGRIRLRAEKILEDLAKEIDLRVMERRWGEIAIAAARQSWTRDPFDRLIAAQAIVEKTRLLSKDVRILEHCSLAFW